MPKDQNNTVQEIVEGVREALRVSLPFASDTNFTKFCEDLERRLCSFRDITYTAGMEARGELLEDYTSWLCKHGYTDADVYAEEPKAVDRYLKELTNKER